MLSPHRAKSDLERALVRASAEEGRAVRAAAVATRHERLAHTGSPEVRSLHACLAGIHRDIERRHLTAATLHRTYVERLVKWSAGRRVTLPPQFLASVATTLGARQVGLTLLGPHRDEESAVASDPVSAAAQELEFTFGEGPAHDAVAERQVVVATGVALRQRWPHYSSAVARLGVRSVAAAPLCLHGACLGVLTTFNAAKTAVLGTVADALVHGCLLMPDGPDPADVPLLAGADHRVVVHQAAGMISEQLGCTADDALALLRARAFAEDMPVGQLAERVVCRQVRFE